MKLKSLLLGSVAALSFGAIATAADLPSAKPVTFACDSFGVGFFALPGTDTCLKIGGHVRADYLVHENNASQARWDGAAGGIPLPATGALVANNADTFATRARAQVDIDARSKTEYGPLRAFARFRTDTRSDTANAGSITSHLVYPYFAFIQFAGITAGMAQSQFDFLTYNWLDSYSASYAWANFIGGYFGFQTAHSAHHLTSAVIGSYNTRAQLILDDTRSGVDVRFNAKLMGRTGFADDFVANKISTWWHSDEIKKNLSAEQRKIKLNLAENEKYVFSHKDEALKALSYSIPERAMWFVGSSAENNNTNVKELSIGLPSFSAIKKKFNILNAKSSDELVDFAIKI